VSLEVERNACVQVLDRETIGLIWAGSIVAWDHPRIKALNPTLADKLPAEPILLGYCDTNSSLSSVEIFKRALEGFSPEFKSAFAAANRTFGLLPPALTGTAVNTSTSAASRIAFLKVPSVTTPRARQQLQHI
jgi:hypothetical protein